MKVKLLNLTVCVFLLFRFSFFIRYYKIVFEMITQLSTDSLTIFYKNTFLESDKDLLGNSNNLNLIFHLSFIYRKTWKVSKKRERERER